MLLQPAVSSEVLGEKMGLHVYDPQLCQHQAGAHIISNHGQGSQMFWMDSRTKT
jgi:hypothetical protein